MLRGKFRTNTCRIIILTSLVWLLVDVIIIMNYTANYTEKRKGEYDVEVSANFLKCLFLALLGIH